MQFKYLIGKVYAIQIFKCKLCMQYKYWEKETILKYWKKKQYIQVLK